MTKIKPQYAEVREVSRWAEDEAKVKAAQREQAADSKLQKRKEKRPKDI